MLISASPSMLLRSDCKLTNCCWRDHNPQGTETESPMSMKLMVVDDDPAALELVQALVEPLGYEVLALADSRQAAECVKEQRFDGIFVDVQMPNLDGFELTSLIRASRSNSRVPIVMITALEDVETMRHGYKAGVTFFLTKPFNSEKLRGLLLTMRSTILREKTRYVRLPFF